MLVVLNIGWTVTIFEFMAHSLYESLREIGCDCKLIENKNEDVFVENKLDTYIIFGCHEYKKMPTKYIVYNYEQLMVEGAKWFDADNNYHPRLKGALCVWDYSIRNVEFLRSKGIKCYHVPFGYSRCLEHQQTYSREPIDILFYGSLTDRRWRALNRIQEHGLKVVTRYNLWKDEYWEYMKSSKIVLNIHFYYTNTILEVSRIIPLICNKILVISERSSDKLLDEQFSKYVILCDLEEIPSMCKKYLTNDKLREEHVNRAYDLFVKDFKYTDFLIKSTVLDTFIDKISLVVPTRNRVDNLTRLIKSVEESANKPHQIEFCLYIDSDDDKSKEKLVTETRSNIKFIQGEQKPNHDMMIDAFQKLASGNIIMRCSDDVIFRTKGWDDKVRNEFSKSLDKILLVYPDNGEKLLTTSHYFVHRRWIEATNCIYSDLVKIARKIKRDVYLKDVLIEHMHFSIGKSELDQVTLDNLLKGSKAVETDDRTVEKLIGCMDKKPSRYRTEEFADIVTDMEKDREEMNTHNKWRFMTDVDYYLNREILFLNSELDIDCVHFIKSGNHVTLVTDQDLLDQFDMHGYKLDGRFVLKNSYPFFEATDKRFDLFFSNLTNTTLDADDVVKRAKELLKKNGKITLVLPKKLNLKELNLSNLKTIEKMEMNDEVYILKLQKVD